MFRRAIDKLGNKIALLSGATSRYVNARRPSQIAGAVLIVEHAASLIVVAMIASTAPSHDSEQQSDALSSLLGLFFGYESSVNAWRVTFVCRKGDRPNHPTLLKLFFVVTSALTAVQKLNASMLHSGAPVSLAAVWLAVVIVVQLLLLVIRRERPVNGSRTFGGS